MLGCSELQNSDGRYFADAARPNQSEPPHAEKFHHRAGHELHHFSQHTTATATASSRERDQALLLYSTEATDTAGFVIDSLCNRLSALSRREHGTTTRLATGSSGGGRQLSRAHL